MQKVDQKHGQDDITITVKQECCNTPLNIFRNNPQEFPTQNTQSTTKEITILRWFDIMPYDSNSVIMIYIDTKIHYLFKWHRTTLIQGCHGLH